MEEFDLSQFDAPRHVTAEFVLDQVDEVLIYRHYVGAFTLGKKIKHPFRKDLNPSFAIFFGTRALKLLWKDFGTGESGDCFAMVSKMCKCPYKDAIEKVAEDFGLIEGVPTITKKQILEAQAFKEELQNREYLIQIERRPMNKEELDYWSEYSISREELKANSIFAINKLWINKKAMRLDVSKLHFAYYFPEVDKWKIYSPDSTDFKWFGNVSTHQMEGVTDLSVYDSSKPIIITKSRKDRIVLKKIYPNVVSCQNESEGAIPRGMDVLFDQHFPAKYCWFDSDEPGKNANRKLNHRGYKWVNVSNELYQTLGLKDPSDVIKRLGLEAGNAILLNELNKKSICA